MTDSNTSKNSEIQIIQEYLDHASGNVLLCSDNSDMINSLSNENLQVLSNTSHSLSIHIDSLLLTNTFHNELSKFDQKFGTIIIDNLLEQINYPELFIRNLTSILDSEGIIICSTSNFFHITNIINLLTGNIFRNEYNNTIFDSLEKFLQFLNQNNLHVTKVSRIKKEFSSQEMNIDDTLIPPELLGMIEKISDSDTLKYIFMIGEGKTVSTENFEFISQFPKNYLLPKLKEFFEKFSELGDKLEQQKKYTESLVKEIDSMTDGRSLTEKEKLIEGYKKSVVEQKEYTGLALSEKEKLIEGYKKSVVEQKEYTGQALSEKEKLIEGYKKSVVEQKEYTRQALSAKEKLIRGHEDSIQKLKKIIQGHEASIKEQKDYIENLEKNIHDLELRLAKLAFWKKK